MCKQIRNSLVVLILAMMWLCSYAQRSNLGASKVAKIKNGQVSLIHDIEKASGYRYIYTDSTYASSSGRGITIQNSFPKGGNIEPGTPYVDSSGKEYFFAGFWTRIINETNRTLEFEVNFPAHSFPLSPPSESYLKLFIPPDSMTVDQLASYNWGLTGMKLFVDTNFNKATILQKRIKQNEEHIFYTVIIAYQSGGPARSTIILNEEELLYRITMGSHGSLEIPCGKISFINEDRD